MESVQYLIHQSDAQQLIKKSCLLLEGGLDY